MFHKVPKIKAKGRKEDYFTVCDSLYHHSESTHIPEAPAHVDEKVKPLECKYKEKEEIMGCPKKPYNFKRDDEIIDP